MNRFRLIAIFFCAICLLVVMTIYAKTIAERASPGYPGTAATRKVENTAQPSVTQKEILIDSYVVPGLPVTLSNVIAQVDQQDNQNDDWAAALQFSVKSQSKSKLTGLNLALLDFNGAGRLSQVDGWVKTIELLPAGSTEVRVELKRRITPGDRLVLAIERVNGTEGTRDVSFTDLARTVAALVTAAPTQAPAVQFASTALPDDYGSSLCRNALARAMALSQAGDKTRVTSYTCDQYDRSWSITFNGKILTQ
jgi:hypothetical protein